MYPDTDPYTEAMRALALWQAPAPRTWSAYEPLPDGREHELAHGLTYTGVLAARFPGVDLVEWREDGPPEAVDICPGCPAYSYPHIRGMGACRA